MAHFGEKRDKNGSYMDKILYSIGDISKIRNTESDTYNDVKIKQHTEPLLLSMKGSEAVIEVNSIC